MDSEVIIQSRLWPTAIGLATSSIATIALVLWIGVNWSSLTWVTRLGYAGAFAFLLGITIALGLITSSKLKNRALVIIKADSITFFHNSWKSRKVTLNRSQVAAIRVDQSYSDTEGAHVVVQLREGLKADQTGSKVWSAQFPNNILVYEYGDATVSSDELGAILDRWLSEEILQ